VADIRLANQYNAQRPATKLAVPLCSLSSLVRLCSLSACTLSSLVAQLSHCLRVAQFAHCLLAHCLRVAHLCSFVLIVFAWCTIVFALSSHHRLW
jgi:hypothetical protein